MSGRDIGVEDLVKNAAMAKAFEGTNFGSEKPRDTIFDTLLKRATGYHAGHTAEQITAELGLTTTKTKKLTRAGKRYLYVDVINRLKP